jgi:hypothetical protein
MVPISLRAAAIAIHGSGVSAGVVGKVPANGLSNSPMAWVIAVATVSMGACCFGGAGVTSSEPFATVTVAVDVLTVSVRGVSVLGGSVLDGPVLDDVVLGVGVLVDSRGASFATLVSDDAVVTSIFGVGSPAVLADSAAAAGLRFFFVFCCAAVESVESAVLSLGSVLSLGLSEGLSAGLAEAPDVPADDDEGDD